MRGAEKHVNALVPHIRTLFRKLLVLTAEPHAGITHVARVFPHIGTASLHVDFNSCTGLSKYAVMKKRQ
jgi:hypothetical protein